MIIKSSINSTLILSTIVDVKDKKIEDVIYTPSTKYKFYRITVIIYYFEISLLGSVAFLPNSASSSL